MPFSGITRGMSKVGTGASSMAVRPLASGLLALLATTPGMGPAMLVGLWGCDRGGY